jgi:asparagine synthase (glutamine-hydrolysing)
VCGIAGIVRLDKKSINQAIFYDALSLMRHRGPDDEGAVLIEGSTGRFEERGGPDSARELRLVDFRAPTKLKADVALASRRLSIIDLSARGHQPQCNEDHRVWIVFNGEVYNYRELRNELVRSGHVFTSDTDTEVIIHGYEEWGIGLLLSRMMGMWGFALWDQNTRKLYLVRDRFGIKPLYYHFDEAQLLFASEIKAIRRAFSAKINDRRVSEFLWFRPYKPDETFFDGVNQVMAAHYVELDVTKKSLQTMRYWELSELNSSYKKTDFAEATKSFYELFEQSIRLHMRSDVPVGTCLSGGLDSSSIVCLSQKLLRAGSLAEKGLKDIKSLKTFSSAPQEKRISEVPYIEEVVKHSGVVPYFTTPLLDDFLEDFDKLVAIHDEPFQDPSVYMQYRVIKLAKENGIKVLLDGQGGDECLSGYQRYIRDYLKDLLREKKYLKALMSFFGTLDMTTPFFWRYIRKTFGRKQGRPDEVVTVEKPAIEPQGYEINNLANRLRYDLLAGSITELLKYEDTNSMAFSIESRVPFLFHPLIEYLFKLPMSTKINGRWTKYVLRQAMKGVLPEKVRMRRSKMGFPAPSEEWAKRLIRDKKELCIETAAHAKDYVNLKNLENLFTRILAKGRSEDVELFWRILILSRWSRAISMHDDLPENPSTEPQ